jgi:asparagine synthase (glutamine-hydrolysing)
VIRFLCISWIEADERIASVKAQMRARSGWRLRCWSSRSRIWTFGDAPSVDRLPGGGFLLGDVFAALGERPLDREAFVRQLPLDGEAAGQKLIRGCWGEYIALFEGAGGLSVLRDPSGALDCLCWTLEGLDVVASDLEAAPPGLTPRRTSLDWSAIADILDDPIAADREIALEGVVSPLPGRLEPVKASGSRITLWAPETFGANPDGKDAEARLIATLDHCVATLAQRHSRLIGEISGGLDSAIIAASLAASGENGRVQQWLNYFTDRREGDEREYAQAVAERLDVPLTFIAKSRRPLAVGDFTSLCRGARAPVNGGDPARDQDTAERLLQAGASGLLSGQGGDAVLFQPPSIAIAVDRFRLEGFRGLTVEALADTARLSRRSNWAVLREVFRKPGDAVAPESRLGLPRGWARPVRSYQHPWFAGSAGLPPAKREQIHGIANAQLLRGDSLRARAAALVYPLLAQPLVELCLQLPVPVLTVGGRDRGLARTAFRPRLPACVVDRRGKGDLGSFYGRLIADSLDYLRPHLLDGVLCDAGLLDRDGLDLLLRPEQLITRGAATGILQATVVETWIRYWQGRVPDSSVSPRARA